ncbi:carboxypeptidase S1, putative [Cordyceps militaris CM01]|uniref:Carboxypeptidase n=1 Tax=Cordyceps militaris (strain CM01) TaxID=983644 RepID=G3JMY5_CORMM|nr:carboxypeptidase S1, putative [Cordyceps militaris CM01]EGX90167.1 carboxypeptidase S1, putative [Cordyceps militaris CM01]
MRFVPLALTALAGLGAALPQETTNKQYKRTEGDVEYSVFEHAATGTSLKYVSNSGICETTPGVNQYSGYQTVGDNQNMWWWFFEARSNAKTAPLALWLNGGPGCSSMLGLFQENGPCTFNDGGSQPKLNPYSWNTFANMLYVDQPIGAGFSYGDVNAVDSTPHAAPAVWAMLQAFLTRFPEYRSRDFGLFSESYGGHYGPAFADYFEQQNAAIDAGTVTGEKVHLVALGVNNGWIDPKNQYRAYIDFAVKNQYRPLLSADDAQKYYDDWQNKCAPAYDGCSDDASTNKACARAGNECGLYVESPLEELAQFDVYDIRADSDSFPPSTFVNYITSASVMKAIGATSNFSSCGRSAIGGDDSARSFLAPLSRVIQSNVNVLVWAGDADWICNWMGNYDAVQSIAPQEFVSAAIQPYTVGGKKYGEYKTAGNLNWLRVYDAGHEVPAYQPEAALAAFTSIMSKQSLKAT